MSDTEDFDGDACIVLPKDYLNSAEAVADIYEDELSDAATSFDVDQFSYRKRFFQGSFFVASLWAISAIWTVCL